MDNLTVKLQNSTIDYDLENGFVWAIHAGENIFQACLALRVDGNGFKKVIDRNDSGYDWGMSGDHNSDNATENNLHEFLKLAAKNAIRVI
jgi:hypothetical protein